MAYKNKLITLPRDVEIYHNLIKEAKSELQISRQALPNIDFCNLLIDAKKRGVNVQLLLTNPQYFNVRSVEEIIHQHGVNYDIASYSKITIVEKTEFITHLEKNGIYPRYINHDRFFLNHSKYMVIDSKILFLGSAPNEHTTRFDAGIISTDERYISMFTDLFQADFSNQIFDKNPGNEIAVAPLNLREIIENFLASAQESIYLMFPVITDDASILSILENKLQQNVQVTVLCSPDIFVVEEENIDLKYNKLLASYGARFKESYEPIIHNRAIIIDPQNTKGANPKAFLGSGNLKTSSLDKSRETGLVVSEDAIINELFTWFQNLWANTK